MPPADRHQQPLRLPRELAAAVRKRADRTGVSFNAYVVLALQDRLEREAAREGGEDRRRPDKGERLAKGLGLGLRSLGDPSPAVAPVPPDPAPVVVNVGGGAAAPEGGLVAGLARYVTDGGSAFLRDQRRRHAVDVLSAQAESAQQREQLVSQLDRLLAERPARSALQPMIPRRGPIGSLFR